jgi:hypothetical protein
MTEAVFPLWLHWLSIVSLGVACLCACFIIYDEIRRPHPMWIMNLVWPLTALFGSLLWLGLYLVWGRGEASTNKMGKADHASPGREPPFWVLVAKGSSHCGAGCTLGDLTAEWLAFAVPGMALALGWKSVFADKIFAVWVLDFIPAFLFGVLFQYFTIQPMRDLSIEDGIVAALKADTASIFAWQIGMYGFMAIGQFVWFQLAYGGHAATNTPEFWFLMQLAMLCGFATSFPTNWLLLKWGVKEKM